MTDRQQLLDKAARCGKEASRFGLLAAHWRTRNRPGLAKLMTDLAADYRRRGSQYLDRAAALDMPASIAVALDRAIASVVPAGHGKRCSPASSMSQAPLAPCAPSVPPPVTRASANAVAVEASS